MEHTSINIYIWTGLEEMHLDHAWKYKIGSGKTPVILMLVMFVLFGGLTLWLHRANNRAVIFLGMLTAVMALVFILTIYRFLFYKVLIGANGFYYQTGVGNGKYYAYTEVEKAWISSGISQHGRQEDYCNISFYNKKVIRFPFFYNDEKGVKYLVKLANAEIQRITTTAVQEKNEYFIDGKSFGKTKIVFGVIILAILAVLDILLIRQAGFLFILISSIAMAGVTACFMFNYYLFFQVKIGKDGFYCRTTPFNGQYYLYNEVVSCREIKRVKKYRHRHPGSMHKIYYFYFEFTDVKGVKRRFQFDQPIHEYEVKVLRERIETAHGLRGDF